MASPTSLVVIDSSSGRPQWTSLVHQPGPPLTAAAMSRENRVPLDHERKRRRAERQAREADARVVNRQAITAKVEERLTKARERANVNLTRAVTAPVGGVAPAPRPPAVNGDSTNNQLARAARAVLKVEPGLSYKEVASRLAAEGYLATIDAADSKLATMDAFASCRQLTHLGMPHIDTDSNSSIPTV